MLGLSYPRVSAVLRHGSICSLTPSPALRASYFETPIAVEGNTLDENDSSHAKTPEARESSAESIKSSLTHEKESPDKNDNVHTGQNTTNFHHASSGSPIIPTDGVFGRPNPSRIFADVACQRIAHLEKIISDQNARIEMLEQKLNNSGLDSEIYDYY